MIKKVKKRMEEEITRDNSVKGSRARLTTAAATLHSEQRGRVQFKGGSQSERLGKHPRGLWLAAATPLASNFEHNGHQLLMTRTRPAPAV